jgi:hypothetical protein
MTLASRVYARADRLRHMDAVNQAGLEEVLEKRGR